MTSRKALSNLGGRIREAGDPDLSRVLREAFVAAAETSADRFTHGFHSYPARMHPKIAELLVAGLTDPDMRVLDPFCGSGTVLVESLAQGREAFGLDANPLAVQLAKVKTLRPSKRDRDLFLDCIIGVAERSTERVQTRVPVIADLHKSELQWYAPHVLKEMAGLLEELRAVEVEWIVRGMEMVFSALVVKFSKQKADTSEEMVEKRLRKGLVTEFFVQKGHELVSMWEAFERVAGPFHAKCQVYEGDARKLATSVGRSRYDAIITSPPYGGTYDYVDHHRRRAAWLGIKLTSFEHSEMGARRRQADIGIRGWDKELSDVLAGMHSVLSHNGVVVLLIGDAELGGRRIPADEQFHRIAPQAGFQMGAVVSQARVDWSGGTGREEHLIALLPA